MHSTIDMHKAAATVLLLRQRNGNSSRRGGSLHDFQLRHQLLSKSRMSPDDERHHRQGRGIVLRFNHREPKSSLGIGKFDGGLVGPAGGFSGSIVWPQIQY